ncbi:cytochrome c [Octadecabacter sp. CECT 8868]|nr:cytochrome c [Octadecabacter algicola]MCF2905750.1 cytochrome c [Octadecabacter algicola]
MSAKFFTVFTAATVGLAATMAEAEQDTLSQVNLFAYEDLAAVAQGAELYATNCASCHGENLEGQENWRTLSSNGRSLAPPHDASGHTWHHPDVQLFQIVKFGTAVLVGNGYESDMAGYEGILSDDEIRNVMAFIKSTWPSDIVERHNAMNAAVAAQN